MHGDGSQGSRLVNCCENGGRDSALVEAAAAKRVWSQAAVRTDLSEEAVQAHVDHAGSAALATRCADLEAVAGLAAR